MYGQHHVIEGKQFKTKSYINAGVASIDDGCMKPGTHEYGVRYRPLEVPMKRMLRF